MTGNGNATEVPYKPAVMRFREWLGPAIKKLLVPDDSVRRRWWWNRLFVQVAEPHFFDSKSEEDIYRDLGPAATRASEVLEQARHLADEERERGANVEQRATALQAAVAIASTFILAGAGALLTSSRPLSGPWRTLIAIPFILTVICLIATGIRALRTTVRVHAFEYPDPEGPINRAQLSEAQSKLHQAAELLYGYNRNQPIVDYKVAQMRAAGHWFLGALAGLLITGVAVSAALLQPVETMHSHSHPHSRPIVATGQCQFVGHPVGHGLALGGRCRLSAKP